MSAAFSAFCLASLLAASAWANPSPASVAGACPDCSILLISLDTLRADAVGVYRSGGNSTPHLDRLASSGTVFLNAFSQASVTMESHMSIFTGRYPWKHGVSLPMEDVLDEGIPTLPQILREHGYDTAWIGPRDDMQLGESSGFLRGIGDRVYTKYSARRPWAQAGKWLAARAGRKTFLFLHSYHAHEPYLPYQPELLPPQYRGLASPKGLDSAVQELVLAEPVTLFAPLVIWTHHERFRPERRRENWPWMLSMAKIPRNVHISLDRLRAYAFFRQFDLGDAQDVGRMRGLYDACARDLDADVGEVLSMLDRVGVSSRTIVVVTADHGEAFMEHGRVTHTSLYAEELQVPLLMRIPGAPAGGRVRDVVQSVDILPTLLDSVGLPTPSVVDGVSLLPLVRREVAAPRLALANRRRDFSLRDGEFTYMRMRRGPDLTEALYDRRADPGEKTDLSAQRPEVLLRYRRLLEVSVPAARSVSGREREFSELSPFIKNQIRQTGYW